MINLQWKIFRLVDEFEDVFLPLDLWLPSCAHAK